MYKPKKSSSFLPKNSVDSKQIRYRPPGVGGPIVHPSQQNNGFLGHPVSVAGNNGPKRSFRNHIFYEKLLFNNPPPPVNEIEIGDILKSEGLKKAQEVQMALQAKQPPTGVNGKGRMNTYQI